MKCLLVNVLGVCLLCYTDEGLSAVWDYDCESAINQLKNEQEEVESSHSDFESAQSEMESARSFYQFCTPSPYEDCEFQRMQVNSAIQTYNDALSDLKSNLSDFESAVYRFKTVCLQ